METSAYQESCPSLGDWPTTPLAMSTGAEVPPWGTKRILLTYKDQIVMIFHHEIFVEALLVWLQQSPLVTAEVHSNVCE